MKIGFLIVGFLPFYLLASYPGMTWENYHSNLLKKPEQADVLALSALQSDDWALREAGLKTLVATNTKKAKEVAKKLILNDPALLVRSSAVTAIKILKDKKSEDVLWRALEDKRNFRKNQSLWIRPQILATLIEFGSQNLENYKKLKNDIDPQVVRLAQSQLAKVEIGKSK